MDIKGTYINFINKFKKNKDLTSIERKMDQLLELMKDEKNNKKVGVKKNNHTYLLSFSTMILLIIYSSQLNKNKK